LIILALARKQVEEHNFPIGVGAKSTPAIAPPPIEAAVEEEEEDPDADLFKKVLLSFLVSSFLFQSVCT